MLKNFRDRIALSGITVLGIGIALLIFTFASAYGFLASGLSIIATEDLAQTFGEALAPLIGTCIRVMYLGVMGWMGSLITIRGVTLIAHLPPSESSTIQSATATSQSTSTQTKPQTKTQPTQSKSKSEEKPKEVPKSPSVPEPQVIVIPPEQTMVQAETAVQAQQINQQNQHEKP